MSKLLAMTPTERAKYPLASSIVDLWLHPYSSRLLMFAARQMHTAMSRGCPSILE